jgi:hypothetical protein
MPTIILELREVSKVCDPGIVEHPQEGGDAVEDTTSYHKGPDTQIDDPTAEEDAS